MGPLLDARLLIAGLLWIALFTLCVSSALRRSKTPIQAKSRFEALFLVLVSAALVAWRWRSLAYNGEINVDEGSHIAALQRFLLDWMPWRSVETGTCGPLNFWIVLWAPILGLPLNYYTLRITGIILNFLLIWGLRNCLGQIVGHRLSYIFVLPIVSLILFTINLDFLFFANELLPSVVFAWLIFLIIKDFRSENQLRSYTIGLLAGALPFTKLQASLIGIFLFGTCVLYRFTNGTLLNPRPWRLTLMQTLGGITIPSCILGPVWLGGGWSDFWHFYIQSNLIYKSSSQKIPLWLFVTQGCEDFGCLFQWTTIAIGLAGAIIILRIRNYTDKRKLSFLCFALVSFNIISTYSVIKSGFYFPHYLILLLVPLSMTLSSAFACAVYDMPEQKRLTSARTVVCFITITSCAQVSTLCHEYTKLPHLVRNWGSEASPMADILREKARLGDTMAIWGWANKLHVFTGIRSATRIMGTAYVTDPSPAYDAHRTAYLKDLKASRARFFLDAVDEFRWPTWPPGILARHFGWPELARHIHSEYHLIGEFRSAPNKLPILLYEHN
jgi:hypothetical protein